LLAMIPHQRMKPTAGQRIILDWMAWWVSITDAPVRV
jgi:hypothetical protein